jgi:hypothetical protein
MESDKTNDSRRDQLDAILKRDFNSIEQGRVVKRHHTLDEIMLLFPAAKAIRTPTLETLLEEIFPSGTTAILEYAGYITLGDIKELQLHELAEIKIGVLAAGQIAKIIGEVL